MPNAPKYIDDFLRDTGLTSEVATRVSSQRDLSDEERTEIARNREVDRLQAYTKVHSLAVLALMAKAAIHSARKTKTQEIQ
jgi:hypothetical protein